MVYSYQHFGQIRQCHLRGTAEDEKPPNVTKHLPTTSKHSSENHGPNFHHCFVCPLILSWASCIQFSLLTPILILSSPVCIALWSKVYIYFLSLPCMTHALMILCCSFDCSNILCEEHKFFSALYIVLPFLLSLLPSYIQIFPSAPSTLPASGHLPLLVCQTMWYQLCEKNLAVIHIIKWYRSCILTNIWFNFKYWMWFVLWFASS
jgi:hypothetical protein